MTHEMARSLTISSTSPSDSDEGPHNPEDSLNVLEKQESNRSLETARARDSNTQAVPGVQVDEAEYDGPSQHTEPGKECAEPRHNESGRTGLGGAIEKAISRTSTKSSWNPGPPPDGGLKAWMAGEFFATQNQSDRPGS